MGRAGFKGAIEAAGQTHIGHALNTQSHGKLDDPKNPNTFLSTDPDKSGRAKKKENDPKWATVSGKFAHDLKGNVPLHTDGAGPLKPDSIAHRVEIPAVQRPGGPATSITRIDHNTGAKTLEWQRQQSRPGSPEKGSSNPPVRPASPPTRPPSPASPASPPKKQRRALYAAARAYGLSRRDAIDLAEMMATY